MAVPVQARFTQDRVVAPLIEVDHNALRLHLDRPCRLDELAVQLLRTRFVTGIPKVAYAATAFRTMRLAVRCSG
jgi:hypothetical protein